MQRLFVSSTAVLAVFTGAVNADLTITSDGDGLGSVAIVSQEPVSYTDWNGYTGNTTIVTKTFDEFGAIESTLSWDEAADLLAGGYSGGLRWFERIYNDSGVAWTGYSMTISENASAYWHHEHGYTAGSSLPDEALSDFVDGGIDGDPTNWVSTITLLGNEPVISPDRKVLLFTFDTPVAPGSFLEVHTNIRGLSNSGGSVVLTQTPIPAPGAVLLGALGLGLVGWVKRRFALSD